LIENFRAIDNAPSSTPQRAHDPALRQSIRKRSVAESSREIADDLELNVKTVLKWSKRAGTADKPMGPKNPVSTVFTLSEEATIILYRKYTRLTLDETLVRLRPMMPHLSRSSLQRCLKRYEVNKIPFEKRKKLLELPVKKDSGHLFFEIHALPGGASFLFFAISNLTKYVAARVVEKADAYAAVGFLKQVVERAPFNIRTVETNNHEAFTDSDAKPWDAKFPNRLHPLCRAYQDKKILPMVVKVKDPAPKNIAKGLKSRSCRDAKSVCRRTSF
jgi:hypothetical protein